MTRIAAIMALLLPVALEAATLGEESRLVINPINSSDFEVIELRGMGPTEYWCAAASFNEVRRGRSETLPLYIKSPRGPSVTAPGRKGVVFTIDPSGLADVARLNTVSVDRAGLTFKSAVARRYCRDAFTRSTK